MRPERLPGERLLPIARRLLPRHRVEQVVEPPLADLHAEWLAARARGSRWDAGIARLRGYRDILAAVSLAVLEDGAALLRRVPAGLVVPALVAATLGVAVLRALSSFAAQQLAFLAVALLLFAGVALVPPRWLSRSPWALLGASATLLVLVAFFGERFDGATRWLALGPLLVQPAQLCQPLVILALAGVLARRKAITRSSGILAGFARAAIVIVPVALQPDPATVIALVFATGAMLFTASEGARPRCAAILGTLLLLPLLTLSSAGSLGVPARALAQALTQNGLLGGGLTTGAGPGAAELHTDLLLTGVAERAGLLGVALIVLPLIVLVVRVASIARRSEDRPCRLLAAGVAAQLTGSLVAHLLFPSGAILLSYGGSSLVAVFASLGVVAGAAARAQETRILSAADSTTARPGSG